MKKIIFTIALFTVIIFTNCRKSYVCVCTDINTGERSYGDVFRVGPIAKKGVQATCEAATTIAASDSVTCKLESK